MGLILNSNNESNLKKYKYNKFMLKLIKNQNENYSIITEKNPYFEPEIVLSNIQIGNKLDCPNAPFEPNKNNIPSN